jgi:hypothetical protein
MLDRCDQLSRGNEPSDSGIQLISRQINNNYKTNNRRRVNDMNVNRTAKWKVFIE